jgi:hypothetical protein
MIFAIMTGMIILKRQGAAFIVKGFGGPTYGIPSGGIVIAVSGILDQALQTEG